jgi:hypothetical protein
MITTREKNQSIALAELGGFPGWSGLFRMVDKNN